MSMKTLADEAIAQLGKRMESHTSSLCATEDEVYMAAMACRIQELENPMYAWCEESPLAARKDERVKAQQMEGVLLKQIATLSLSADMKADEIIAMIRMISDLRTAVKTMYAQAGEDPAIAKTCQEALGASEHL